MAIKNARTAQGLLSVDLHEDRYADESNRLSNTEIMELNYELARKCTSFQMVKWHYPMQYYDDILHDLCEIILTRDNIKLNATHFEGHMCAWLTGILHRMIYSNVSNQYRRYRKFDLLSDEITAEQKETIPDE